MCRSRSKSAHKCIPLNTRCVQNFIQIGCDLAVRGLKTCFRVKTEHGLAFNERILQVNKTIKFVNKYQLSRSVCMSLMKVKKVNQ